LRVVTQVHVAAAAYLKPLEAEMKFEALVIFIIIFIGFFIRWKRYENFPGKKFQTSSKKEAISGVLCLASFIALAITGFVPFAYLGFVTFIATIIYNFRTCSEVACKPINNETAKWFVDPGYNLEYDLCPHCGKAKVRKNEIFKKCPVCKKRF
jgi:hypothetical protein